MFTSNNVEALKVALSDPPAGSKDKTLKVSLDTHWKLCLLQEMSILIIAHSGEEFQHSPRRPNTVQSSWCRKGSQFSQHWTGGHTHEVHLSRLCQPYRELLRDTASLARKGEQFFESVALIRNETLSGCGSWWCREHSESDDRPENCMKIIYQIFFNSLLGSLCVYSHFFGPDYFKLLALYNDQQLFLFFAFPFFFVFKKHQILWT